MPFVYVCMTWVEMVIGDISVGQVCIGTQYVSNQILQCKLCGKQLAFICPKTSAGIEELDT